MRRVGSDIISAYFSGLRNILKDPLIINTNPCGRGKDSTEEVGMIYPASASIVSLLNLIATGRPRSISIGPKIFEDEVTSELAAVVDGALRYEPNKILT